MQVFLMHVGSPGNRDIAHTVTKKRSRSEVLNALAGNSREADFFRSDTQFLSAFPDGSFNCWGVPSGAKPNFQKTQVGDLVLMFPTARENGALEQIGVIKAKCNWECWEASRILWPDPWPGTSDQRLFPYLFFFDTEVGCRYWFDFLDDVEYSHDFDPRGHYLAIASRRFDKWGGPPGYLAFLRSALGFRPL